jgi:hypothetical protein
VTKNYGLAVHEIGHVILAEEFYPILAVTRP